MRSGILTALVSLGLFCAAGFASMHAVRLAVQFAAFSPKDIPAGLWEDHRKRYWDRDTGRTSDPGQGGITTSEGQSYTMLRAAWIGDRATFDLTWRWTRAGLQRPSDNLFAWLYGRRKSGRCGVLIDSGGMNTAADADTDIAFALILAYSRWGDRTYLANAREIIRDIWNQEVVLVGDAPVLAADNLEKDSPRAITVNPSYFAPYAFRYFAQLDPNHDWQGVVDSSYALLQRTSEAPLDRGSTANLPPNWVRVDRHTGNIAPVEEAGKGTDFGFDAFRTTWRLALDWKWNHDPRAKQALNRLQYIAQEWHSRRRLASVYLHDGTVGSPWESREMYAGALSLLSAVDPPEAERLFRQELLGSFNPWIRRSSPPPSYYANSWMWFAAALYFDALPDLPRQVASWEVEL